jgi:hypothetical protein
VNGLTFSLQPFPGTHLPSPLQISGSIVRRSRTLDVRCTLAGDLADVAIPPATDTPLRKQGLWEETCFEVFLAAKAAPRYWEFNLSPAGHWNAYSFRDYREGMEEEGGFAALPFRARRQGDSFVFTVELDLGGVVQGDETIEAALCAVVRHTGGALTYWALTHRGSSPDFHRRDSFTLELA